MKCNHTQCVIYTSSGSTYLVTNALVTRGYVVGPHANQVTLWTRAVMGMTTGCQERRYLSNIDSRLLLFDEQLSCVDEVWGDKMVLLQE